MKPTNLKPIGSGSITLEIGETVNKYFVEFYDNDIHQRCNLELAKGDMASPEERRFTLDTLFVSILEIIRKHFFPNDTLIYDTKVTSTGVKMTNPKYSNT